jgi:hypothetical protein
MIAENKVRHFLRKSKYTFITFSSGFAATEIKNADVYISPPWSSINEFQNLLIQTTPLPALLNKLPMRSAYDQHRERILYILEHLADSREVRGPVFVFAHILAPHPPFVFGESGEPLNRGKDFSIDDGNGFMKTGTQAEYLKQLIFINKKIVESIDKILKTAPKPPIIILQSDHGPGANFDMEAPEKSNLQERMSILNAYYFPDRNYTSLYESISPVNTFRVLLNHYFDEKFTLLGDRSYFSSETYPYKFLDVTDRVDTNLGNF